MPSARFHGDGIQQLIADLAAPDSAISVVVNASTGHRMWLYEINMGNVGTPADLVSIYYIGQVTADGAGTTLVPTMIEDGADQASKTVSLSNHSTEPTYVATIAGTGVTTPADGDLLRVPLNHRATYRWVAPPSGEFVAPATSGRGWAGVAAHASATTDYMIGFHWIELHSFKCKRRVRTNHRSLCHSVGV